MSSRMKCRKLTSGRGLDAENFCSDGFEKVCRGRSDEVGTTCFGGCGAENLCSDDFEKVLCRRLFENEGRFGAGMLLDAVGSC